MSEDVVGIFDDDFQSNDGSTANENSTVDQSGWNMPAVEQFQAREQGIEEQPTIESESDNPFASLNGRTPAPTPTPTQTMAPEQPQAKSITETVAERIAGINPIPALSQIRSIWPVGVPISEGLIWSTKPADVTIDDWRDQVYKRMAEYQSSNQYVAPLLDIPGQIVGGSAAGKIVGSVAPKLGAAIESVAMPTTKTSAAISGAISAADMPQYDPSQRGLIPSIERAAAGGVLGLGLGKFAELGRPAQETLKALSTADVVNKRLSGKSLKILTEEEKLADAEVKQALEKMKSDPDRYDGIANTDEARTRLIAETTAIIEKIQKTGSEYEKNIDSLRDSFSKSLNALKMRSKELGESPDNVFDAMLAARRSALEYKNAKYNAGWENLPGKIGFQENPSANGYPLQKLINIIKSEKEPNVRMRSGAERGAYEKANEQLDSEIETVINAAVYNGERSIQYDALAESTGLSKQQLIGAVNLMRDKRKPGSLVSDTFGAMDLGNYGTNLKAVKAVVPFLRNVDSDWLRERLSQMFTGYVSERDIARSAAQEIHILPQVQSAYKNIHTKFRNDVSEHFNNAEFNRLTAEGNAINEKFIAPLNSQITLEKANIPKTRSDFISAMKVRDSQLLGGMQEALSLGLIDKKLFDAAKNINQIEELYQRSGFSDMSVDDMIKNMAKRQGYAMDILEGIAKTDPRFASQFKQLQSLATAILSNQKEFDSVIKNAERKFPEMYKKYAATRGTEDSQKASRIAKQLVTGVAGAQRAEFVKGAVDTDSVRALSDLYDFNFSGNKEKVANAIDYARKLREIDILNQPTRVDESKRLRIGKAIMRMGTYLIPHGGMALAAGDALALMGAKSAKEFTNGKWTRLQPFLIERALKERMKQRLYDETTTMLPMDWRSNAGRSTMKFIINRYSPDAADAIKSIMDSKNLTPNEKKEAIDKINDTGIEVEI